MMDEKERARRAAQRPYFIWDYDLTEDDVRAILRGDNEYEKIQMMVRILESCHFDDIWKYITSAELRENWDLIRPRMRREVRSAWDFAMEVWYGIVHPDRQRESNPRT